MIAFNIEELDLTRSNSDSNALISCILLWIIFQTTSNFTLWSPVCHPFCHGPEPEVIRLNRNCGKKSGRDSYRMKCGNIRVCGSHGEGGVDRCGCSCGVPSCQCFALLGLYYTHLNFNAFPKAARRRYSRFNRTPVDALGPDHCCGSKANPCNPKYGPKRNY